MIALSFPNTDSGLLAWSLNFLNLITATPTAYGLVAGDATNYNTVHTAYATALAACDPTVRNKPAVITKNAARDNLKNSATLLANKIYSTASVTDSQKTQLGIPPRAEPTPIPAPSSWPVLDVVSVNAWTAKIRLRDADSGSTRGKPAGVFGASVFSFVGETAPTDIGAWKFEGNTGRVKEIEVVFPSTLAKGTTVWFTAFWFNGRKQSGPACAPISANLPGGSVSMAA
jgi:hypothetical protein